MPVSKPVVLTILDGWGYRPQIENNAIALARKPMYDKLLAEFPNTLLHASDHFVGLPDGQMGNSEVGHLNIGAGRIVQHGHHPHRRADRQRRILHASDDRRGARSMARKADASCICLGWSPTAGCIRTRSISTRC